MTIRKYESADFETIQGWAKARGIDLSPVLLGSNGFLIEDDKGPLAVAFCYLTFDVPLAFLDHLITRPDAGIKAAREAWALMWRTIQGFLSNLRCNDGPLGYKYVRIFCRTPLARFLKAEGWHVSEHTSTQAIYAI